MPMYLFDVLLTLVHEKQLRGNLALARSSIVLHHGSRLFVILLDGEIPEGDLIVGSGSSEDGVFGRVPFDRGDWGFVPVECGYRRRVC